MAEKVMPQNGLVYNRFSGNIYRVTGCYWTPNIEECSISLMLHEGTGSVRITVSQPEYEAIYDVLENAKDYLPPDYKAANEVLSARIEKMEKIFEGIRNAK